MVTLSKIYTRSGDGGRTRLGNNAEVAKTDPRVEAYGAVDELNAVLGLALAHGLGQFATLVQSVQNDLFDLGGDLCCPQAEGEEGTLRIQADQVQRLEQAIDRANEDLPVLRSFVLPGGCAGAAWLHLGRTVCRRAERRAWALADEVAINDQALLYLNRLSDLLFVLARAANQGGEGDILWVPGQHRED
ncbi:MAG: cob(I)yrinic acid a,c-diamide adenosyltransferase [Candidatus Latescibacteria bacterium]|nr:cob(I)yrinic acid a,c-diamide adenosyltransferase [Candidatus Latescibacterota bacterium]